MLEHEQTKIEPEKVGELLALAARLQAEDQNRITLESVAEAAEEAGLEPSYIYEAHQALSHPLTVSLGAPETPWWKRRVVWEFLGVVYAQILAIQMLERTIPAVSLVPACIGAGAAGYFLAIWAFRIWPRIHFFGALGLYLILGLSHIGALLLIESFHLQGISLRGMRDTGVSIDNLLFWIQASTPLLAALVQGLSKLSTRAVA